MENGKERDYILRKFLHTGKEMLVEMRSSLHTGRGKGGLLILFLVFIYGGYRVFAREHEPWDYTDLIVPVIWAMMGFELMFNLQNHKLLYLLPISRKEFALLQIQKMIWSSFMILGVMMFFSLGISQEPTIYWLLIISKAVPISMSVSSYQIVSAQPRKGNAATGSKIYRLSYAVVFLNVAAMLVNFVITADLRSVVGWISPVINYAVNIYAVIYFYRRISYSDVYYDEL